MQRFARFATLLWLAAAMFAAHAGCALAHRRSVSRPTSNACCCQANACRPAPAVSAAPQPLPAVIAQPATATLAAAEANANAPSAPAAMPSAFEALPPPSGAAEPETTSPPPEVVPAPLPAGPVVAAPRPDTISLDQAINATLLADPKLRAGFEAISQANADALTASLKPNPQLFTDIQLLPLTRPFTPTASGGPPQQDVIVTYPIDWFLFGKRAAQMACTNWGVRASEAEYANLMRERVTETALDFYNVVEAKALLDVLKQNVDNLADVEGVTEKAVEAGGRPTVELNRVRLDLLQAQQALRNGELRLIAAKAQLRALFGRTDVDVDFDVSASLDKELTAQPLPVEQAFSIALSNRPDLRALQLRVAEANADMEVQRRKGYPDIAPAFGYTRQYQEAAMAMPDANSWSASVAMSMPIYNRNQGNQAKASAKATQTRYEFRAGQVDLMAEVQTVVQELQTARANGDAIAKEQLQIARQVRDSINTAYGIGGRPLLDVLDAQRNFSQTYSLYVISRSNYWRAVYKYNSVLGQQIAQP